MDPWRCRVYEPMKLLRQQVIQMQAGRPRLYTANTHWMPAYRLAHPTQSPTSAPHAEPAHRGRGLLKEASACSLQIKLINLSSSGLASEWECQSSCPIGLMPILMHAYDRPLRACCSYQQQACQHTSMPAPPPVPPLPANHQSSCCRAARLVRGDEWVVQQLPRRRPRLGVARERRRQEADRQR